jgi:hypothetical protein
MMAIQSLLTGHLVGWGIYVVGFIPAAVSFWLGATGGLGLILCVPSSRRWACGLCAS